MPRLGPAGLGGSAQASATRLRRAGRGGGGGAGPGGSASRVLSLPAASTVPDRVDGLGIGADDYLPKPFDFAELVARIRALARRAAVPLPPVLTHGDLSV